LKEFFITVLWVVSIVDSLLLVLIVLLQSGRGGGLSGMLGGGGAAESALGPKTGLPKITGWMAGIFFVTAILIGILSREEGAMDAKKVGAGDKAPAATTDAGKATTSPQPTTAAKPGTAAAGDKAPTTKASPAPSTSTESKP